MQIAIRWKEFFVFTYKVIPTCFIVLFLAACGSRNETTHQDDPGGIAATVWTDRTELFAEFPPLVAGHEANVALHLTLLEPSKPVVQGQVLVRAVSSDGAMLERKIDTASSPGIYRTTLLFPKAGMYRFQVIVEAAGNDTIVVDSIRVARNENDLAQGRPSRTAPRGISYLKEQQWKTEFRTEVVRKGMIAATLQSIGEIVPRSGGEALVSAPFSGYSPAQAGATFPAPGSDVRKGTALLHLIPSAETQGGSDDFGSRLAAAKAAHDVAAKEMERATRLHASGVISDKEFQQRESEWKRSETAYASLRQVVPESASETDGSNTPGFAIRAPITGSIAQVYVKPGKPVQSGDPLFHLIDSRLVWLRTFVPMSDFSRYKEPVLVAMHLPGYPDPVLFEGRAARRISVASAIDQRTRSIPVIFELVNSNGRFTIGMTGSVQLTSGAKQPGITLPEQAVLEDQGQYFVFVQTGGESFERREIHVGSPQGDRVEILSGVEEGEHVVTKGATFVRLAASASSVPAHGHAH